MVLLVSPSELKRAPDDLIAPEMSFGAVHVPLMFGRPNITGKFGEVKDFKTSTQIGAFSGEAKGIGGVMEGERGGVISFDASRSSSLYGKSGSLQPASVRFLPCIRI